MALTYGFFDAVNGDRVYNSDQMSEYFKGLISDGVYEDIGGAMQVLAGSGMTVNIQTGRMLINSRWLKNDAVYPVTINAAHAILNRYTAIVARLDMGNRIITITTKDGTAAANPTKPTMDKTDEVIEKCLAYIYVGKGATSISQTDITDTRPDTSVCGWVTGIIKQVDTGTLFLQWQSAYEDFYNSFQSWFDALTSQLQVNTYLKKYTKLATVQAIGQTTIALDMLGYTYEAADILLVHINGLYADEGIDYEIVTSPAAGVVVNFGTAAQNVVSIVAIKSVIGDPVAGGTTIEPITITEGVDTPTIIQEVEEA